MNLLALIPFPYRLIALAVLAAALVGFGWVKGAQHGEAKLAAMHAQWDAERVALAKSVNDQRTANAQRSVDVQTRYVTQTVVRDHFITKIAPEVHDATDNLAACRLTGDAVRLLNAARSCASEDRPSTCGADQPLRDPPAAARASERTGSVGVDGGLDGRIRM